MDSLVEAYLVYLNHNNGELQSIPPLPDDPSGVVEIEAVDVFCKCCIFLQRVATNCMSSLPPDAISVI